MKTDIPPTPVSDYEFEILSLLFAKHISYLDLLNMHQADRLWRVLVDLLMEEKHIAGSNRSGTLALSDSGLRYYAKMKQQRDEESKRSAESDIQRRVRRREDFALAFLSAVLTAILTNVGDILDFILQLLKP